MSTTSRFALTALAFALIATGALPVAHSKDPIPEVTVSVHKDGWRYLNGHRVAVVQLSRSVSYADLDITTYSGATELKARITNAATAVCRELRSKHPWASELALPSGSCVQDAIDAVTPELNAAVASAEKTRFASTAGKAGKQK